MSLYPMFVNLNGKLCVVIGGGKVASRKVTGLLAAGANVVIISPQVTEKLQSLHDTGRLELKLREYREGDLSGAFVAFAATNYEAVNLAVCREAEQRGLWINDAMSAERSTFQLPASHVQGELQIAVSTAGASPLLARTIRDELAHIYDIRYERLVKLLGLMRSKLQARGASEEEKLAIFTRCMEMKENIVQKLQGDYDEERLAMLVERLLDQAAGRIGNSSIMEYEERMDVKQQRSEQDKV